MKRFFILSLIILSTALMAQTTNVVKTSSAENFSLDQARQNFKNKTLHYTSALAGVNLMQGNKNVYYNLDTLMNQYTDTKNEYENYSKFKRIGIIFAVAPALAVVPLIFMLLPKDPYSAEPINSQSLTTVIGIGGSVMLVTSIFEGIFLKKATNHFYKAIRLYNRHQILCDPELSSVVKDNELQYGYLDFDKSQTKSQSILNFNYKF